MTLDLTDEEAQCLANMAAGYAEARREAGRPTTRIDGIAARLPPPTNKGALVYCHDDDVFELRRQANALREIRSKR